MNLDLKEQVESVTSPLLISYLLDHSYEPVITWKPDGSIAYWNLAAEELYGFSSQQAVGKLVHELLRISYPIPRDEMLSQLTAQSMWSGELEYITSTGIAMSVESHLQTIELPGHPSLILQNDRDISGHKQTEAAMRHVYEELEARVEERTCQLANANKELESFSYSVSHDLRAPLRSLQGFARILTLDYAGKILDDRGLDLLQRITASVVRMGQLIEDLLKLSRVSRTALNRQSLDLTAMAGEILDELATRDSHRMVITEVQPAMIAFADAGLLRNVMENLLGNAWKFTGKTAAPKISVKMSDLPGTGTVFSFEDNGAGFDMAFADQLFAPFQRLHTSTEFEGTGVGLATVQRVILRHGGTIWAESSPGQGAKFCFTLGQPRVGRGTKDR